MQGQNRTAVFAVIQWVAAPQYIAKGCKKTQVFGIRKRDHVSSFLRIMYFRACVNLLSSIYQTCNIFNLLQAVAVNVYHITDSSSAK